MEGRNHVLPEDVQTVLPVVVAHRLNPAGEMSGARQSDLVDRLLHQIAVN
jgi:MoxR-like ATPase